MQRKSDHINSGCADLVLKNARVVTCDPARPAAGALAVRGEHILLAGTDEEAEQAAGPQTRIIDCRGKTLLPGFIDAHCHIFPFIRRLFHLDLSPASVRSIAGIREAIRRRAGSTPEGTWIKGNGYNEFYLAEKRHPTRRDLDEAAPRHPVIISHRSRHACVLNSLAMKMIGITNESEAPPGGVIERDLETGEPNGILYEMLGYVQERIKSPVPEAELDRAAAEADLRYLSLGITSLGDATASNNLRQWKTFRRLKKENKLRSRIFMMPGIRSLDEFREAGLAAGSGDEHLRLGNLKIVLSEAAGELDPPRAELNRMVIEAGRAGFPVAIHAVERSTVEAAVTALEQPSVGRRHRIEHCSECPPDLRQRLSRIPAVIVSQPPFIFYSGERYLSQVSFEALQWLYPFRSLMECGLTVAGSSDSPIVPNNPLTGIYAAVTRLAESGQAVLPSEAVSVRRALEMYTRNAAYASGEEDIKGTLSPGKLADIVMLSAGLPEIPPEQIPELAVEMTILGGKIVWEKENPGPSV